VRIRAAMAALTLPLAAVVALPALAGTSSGWTDTATKALPLAKAGAVHLGGLAPTTPLRVAVSLRLRDRAGLDRFIASGGTVTPAQFAARWSPTAAQAGAVATYLRAAGFTGVTTMPNRLVITATGAAATAERAFHTGIDAWQLHGVLVFANTKAAAVPTRLGGLVTAVLGLQNAAHVAVPAHPQTHATRPTDVPENCTLFGAQMPSVPGLGQTACTFTPQGFWNVYDARPAPTGAKAEIAIFTAGDVRGVVRDLRAEEKANHLPQVPVTVHQEGPGSAASGVDEWDMDTQYSTGMAGTVKRLHLYTATTLLDPDLTASLAQFVSQRGARAGSMSFGECEYEAALDGTLASNDQLFAEGAAQGQTVFASAGDTGGFCPLAPNNGVPIGAPMQEYPSSSPYVVSVGGTSVYPGSHGGYGSETAWTGGGSGPSLFEAQASWQNGIAPPTNVGCGLVFALPTGCGRVVPDVAMAADPISGAADVYVDGQPNAIGGTSLASPLALGVWARSLAATGNRAGYASSKLYRLNGTTAFHDITTGDTGPYPAAPGYDMATGLGSFDVAKLVAAIRKLVH
jgi:pseudomonalisin